VRGASDEHNARRLAAVGDQDVVQPRAGERRLDRQPEGIGANWPQEDPPANGLEAERQKIHQRRQGKDLSIRLGDALPRGMPVHLSREQHEGDEDHHRQGQSSNTRSGFLFHAALKRSNR
jgi:hypothetical protein